MQFKANDWLIIAAIAIVGYLVYQSGKNIVTAAAPGTGGS
jgi:uncharacterized membrane protein